MAPSHQIMGLKCNTHLSFLPPDFGTLYHSHNVQYRQQITKLFAMYFSPLSPYFFPLKSKSPPYNLFSMIPSNPVLSLHTCRRSPPSSQQKVETRFQITVTSFHTNSSQSNCNRLTSSYSRLFSGLSANKRTRSKNKTGNVRITTSKRVHKTIVAVEKQ